MKIALIGMFVIVSMIILGSASVSALSLIPQTTVVDGKVLKDGVYPVSNAKIVVSCLYSPVNIRYYKEVMSNDSGDYVAIFGLDTPCGFGSDIQVNVKYKNYFGEMSGTQTSQYIEQGMTYNYATIDLSLYRK